MNSDDDFMFGLTLTELIIILFFLLALLALVAISQREDKIALYETQLRVLDESPVEALKKLEYVEPLKKWIDTHTPEELDSAFKTLVEDGQIRLNLTELREELEGTRQRNSAYSQTIEKQEREIRSLANQLQIFVSKSSDMKGQLASVQRQIVRAGKGGAELPPCWPSRGTHKPEYIFNVKLLTGNRLHVTPAWPEHRSDEAIKIPGVAELAIGTMEQAHFNRYARQVRDWGRNQDIACVHFVKISNVSGLDVKTFKRNLLNVENYFYKWLDPK